MKYSKFKNTLSQPAKEELLAIINKTYEAPKFSDLEFKICYLVQIWDEAIFEDEDGIYQLDPNYPTEFSQNDIDEILEALTNETGVLLNEFPNYIYVDELKINLEEL